MRTFDFRAVDFVGRFGSIDIRLVGESVGVGTFRRRHQLQLAKCRTMLRSRAFGVELEAVSEGVGTV